MCLVTKNSETKIANRPIVCYKSLRDLGGELYSSAYDFKYYPGKVTEEVKLRSWRSYNGWRWDEGYHSWKSLVGLDLALDEVAHVFIIPEGAKYAKGVQYNGTGGYVSSQIVLIGSPYKLSTWIEVIKWKLGIKK